MIDPVYLLAPAWVLVCYTDWRYRRIGNAVVLYVAGAGLAVLFLSGAGGTALIPAGVALIIGYAMWALGVIGAGDVKLFSALCLWHSDDVVALAVICSLIGAVIALAYVVLRIWKGHNDTQEHRGIPYGIAIVLASVVLQTGLIAG